MAVETHEFKINTKGYCDIRDVTDTVAGLVEASGISDGTVTVFTPGSTAGITTIEYEPGLLKDLPAAFERLAPREITYAHDATWGDGNGFSHVRAALLGASLTVPFKSRSLLLGTWQQIVVIDFDNRPRGRRVVVQIMGE
jgi:secondary thiamine-phosphate synthase enzyme